jgi:hypothetical protein
MTVREPFFTHPAADLLSDRFISPGCYAAARVFKKVAVLTGYWQ